MSKEIMPKVTGVIIESLPNTTFRVETPEGRVVLAYLSGKMRRFRIKVLVGDKVEVVTDHNGDKGRIERRL